MNKDLINNIALFRYVTSLNLHNDNEQYLYNARVPLSSSPKRLTSLIIVSFELSFHKTE